MAYRAKSAPPCALTVSLPQPFLQRAADSRLTLINAPAGYLFRDDLRAVLHSQGRAVLWLRLGAEDTDPGMLLTSLVAAAQRLAPQAGQATLHEMRRRLGPIQGWPSLFGLLGDDLGSALPAGTALVIETSALSDEARLTLRLLLSHGLPALPPAFSCILSSPDDAPLQLDATPALRLGVRELRVSAQQALALASADIAALPDGALLRAHRLVEGRLAALLGVLSAARTLGPQLVHTAIERAAGLEELLSRLARAWLLTSSAEAQETLALALALGYSHPCLLQAALGVANLPSGPWLQGLEDDWTHLRPLWRPPLRAALRAGATPRHNVLHGAAAFLDGEGAAEQVVPLLLQLGETQAAAEVAEREAPRLLDLGQWELLAGWLRQLPAPVLRARPALVFAGAEIAAGQGDLAGARRSFSVAAALFSAQRATEGACRSLLAESALAIWQGEPEQARRGAETARSMAGLAGLADYQAWANWQLGCLAGEAGRLDEALASFQAAAHQAAQGQTPGVGATFELAAQLVEEQIGQRQAADEHRQAWEAARQAERLLADHLQQMLAAPLPGLPDLLAQLGWSQAPLFAKLPAPQPSLATAAAAPPGIWDQVLALWGRLERRQSAPAPITPAALAGPAPAAPGPPLVEAPLPGVAPRRQVAVPPLPALERPPLPAVRLPPAISERQDQAPRLVVYTLGPFRVLQDDAPIESWPGSKGKAILKYLLANRGRPCPRDVLMDVFWQEAGPEAARNSLNVAMHGLRQVLRRARPDVAYIVYRNDSYALNPEVEVWLDCDAFMEHVTTGQRLERGGRLRDAVAEYELAEELARGDFLEEDLYEDWPMPRRESLRDTYLMLLDRLSAHYLQEEAFAACIRLCQKTLAKDECREDAHRRLMRCYMQQNQRNLAIRQYHICAESLKNVLDVAPMAETTTLYEKILRGDTI